MRFRDSLILCALFVWGATEPTSLPIPPQTTPPSLSRYEMAMVQMALEQNHFSCGFIDGREGRRTARAIAAFQSNQNLPISGTLTTETRARLVPQGEPFEFLVITADHVSKLSTQASTWLEKSKRTYLGYHDLWELAGELSHSTKRFIQELNPKIKNPKVGDRLVIPQIKTSLPLPKIESIRISLSQTSIQGIDSTGKIVTHFACSIAADKQKRPTGSLTVKNFAPNPNYTFDPALFKEVALKENLQRKLIIPPGPNNPVGTAWIGLSLPGYGIHGTPHPEEISATQSHGCFRLCNWNAEKLLKMIRIGMPIYVEE